MNPKFSKTTASFKEHLNVELLTKIIVQTINNLPGNVYFGNPNTTEELRSTPEAKKLTVRKCRKMIKDKFNQKYFFAATNLNPHG